ncbi:efflux RND transporter periplasmic adaptor subunit [Aurantivibrio plasticivorans]
MTRSNQSRNKIITLFLSVFVLVVAIAWMAGFFTSKIEPGLTDKPSSHSNDLIPVAAKLVMEYEPVPASLTAKQATIISSRILARITKINVRAGDSVSEGQLLAELEQTDLQAISKQAAEQVRSIKARLVEAEQNLKRIETLYKDGLVSKADLDRATANQQALAADLSASELALEGAQASLSYTQIKAPIDGRIVDRFAEPGDTATPGSPLLSIYNPLSLQVEAQVRETLAIPLKVGDAINVEVPAFDKLFGATVEEIVPAADSNSRSFTVKARFDYDASLLPGMYARMHLPTGEVKKLIAPKDRVATIGQLNLVWIEVDGQTERRFVKLGQWQNNDELEIVSGVREGELILPIPVVQN